MRINKFIASCGVSSRRLAEEFIRGGRVTVNGAVMTDLAYQVAPTDAVNLDGKPIKPEAAKVYIMLNKPAGCVTTCADRFGRKTVLELLENVTARVFPVGRLDYDTTGLLLLTNDGDFTKAVTHPSGEVAKTYIAHLDKPITAADLDKLSEGVINDGQKTSPAAARFIDFVNKSANQTENKAENKTVKQPVNQTVEITIKEGRNRQVRKMFAALGAKVTRLKRTAIGALTLGNLKLGEWRYIEYEKLSRAVFGGRNNIS